LHHQLGDPAEAAAQFRAHLETHPRGAWNLRAQKALASALSDAALSLQ
jgi:hypothetical protein